jgi:hypothetical protein
MKTGKDLEEIQDETKNVDLPNLLDNRLRIVITAFFF